MASLPRAVPPGTHFNYNTGEAHLIGRFLSRGTGVNLAEYLSQKIWQPYGMESDAFWNTDPSGTEQAAAVSTPLCVITAVLARSC